VTAAERGRGALDRLAVGCTIVARQRSEAIAAWIQAGRRDDLTGWRAALGPATRMLLLGGAAYVALSVLRAVPWLMWAITAWWLRAAWKTTVEKPAEQPPADCPERPDPGPVLELLREVLGDRDRVHLSTVLAHLQNEGQWEGRTVADLRVCFEALGVPVRPKVKVGGVPTRGVLRDDLNDHFPGWETPPVSHQVDAV
jgi:hypothetical protein